MAHLLSNKIKAASNSFKNTPYDYDRIVKGAIPLENKIKPVEAVQKASKLFPVRPVGFAENPRYQSQQKKKRAVKSNREEDKRQNQSQQAEKTGTHIDLNA